MRENRGKGLGKKCLVVVLCVIISFISTLDIVRYDVQALSYKTGHRTSYSQNMDSASKRFLEYNCTKTYANGKTVIRPFSYYLQTKSSYTNIPGLLSTNVCGSDCEDMVPQGICNMGEYVLISAYCHEKEHPPVLYVMKDKSLVATIVLPYSRRMHAGGVTFDGKYVWIANGQTDYGKSKRYDYSKRVYYLLKEQIIAAINESIANNAYSVQLQPSYGNQYVSLQYDPAFCTYYDGYLWCGKFNSTDTDMMYIYEINHNATSNSGLLTNVGDMQVPRATQGLTFCGYSGDVYLMITSSYTGTSDDDTSKNGTHCIITYKPTDYDYWIDKDTDEKDFHKGSRINDITIPYMPEKLNKRNSTLFDIFESEESEHKSNIALKNECDKFCELSFYKICVE